METETLILGAGAAGLFCAAHAGPGVIVVDHARAPAEKVRISGGGRCNFTNLGVDPHAFLSENPHFAKSALSRYTQWDFIELVDRHGIAWHEKTLGQLFCDGSAKEIIAMLMAEARGAGAEVWLHTELGEVRHDGHRFAVTLTREGRETCVTSRHLVLATGGKSIPKMGATGRAYEIARQFGHDIVETRPALVPFTFPDGRFKPLSGVATPVRATAGGACFDEAMLFTHRGLSGPAMLQISSYWREGAPIGIDLTGGADLFVALREARQAGGARKLSNVLARHLPARLVDYLAPSLGIAGNLADQSDAALRDLVAQLRDWSLVPQGTEGYRTAEVTAGGVATDRLSSRSMQSALVPGLFIIGEAVDVTGWLGGYNFQWAWSSAYAAGQAIAARSTSPGAGG